MKKEILITSIVYFFLTIIFFLPLFYPEPHLFVAPDFGRSDIWNFNYPLKDLLSQSLKSGQLPLWAKDIGTGFPLLGEGQVGMFHPMNLILFLLFPTWMAFNFSYIFIFLFAASGTYIFLRNCKLNSKTSFLGGFLFAFSGYNIVQIVHINLLLATVHLPWVMLATSYLLQKKNRWAVMCLSSILTMQFFSGFPQMSFITLFAITLYFLYNILKQQNEHKIRIFIYFFISLLIFVLLSAIQLLPTLEFIQTSMRKGGLTFMDATNFPFPFKHLLSFINPFILGNPKYATYPVFSPVWGIFWENTSYIGILPLFFVLISIIKKDVRKKIIFWLLLLVTSFIIVLGKNSPFYFIFTMLPFSIFRVPSRFLIIFTFSLIVISMEAFEYTFHIVSKKISRTYVNLLYAGGIILMIVNIFLVWSDYQPYGKVSDWLKKPEFAQKIGDKEQTRVTTLPFAGEKWNNIFLKTGWRDTKPYLDLHETLDANYNLIFNIPSYDVYASFYPSRLQYMKMLTNITIDDQNNIKISTAAATLFNISGVKNIISTYKIKDANYALMNEKTIPSTDLFLYENTKVLPRVRFVTKAQSKSTLKELLTTLASNSANLADTVILENEPPLNGEKPEYSVKFIQNTDNKLVLKLKTNQDGYVIIADTFYPGWEATVNNNKVKILPANLNERAIWVKSGENNIIVQYVPQSLKIGAIITLITFIISIIFLRVYPKHEVTER